MLTLQWVLTGAAWLLAILAFAKARRLARRVERLTESYWELRYEHGQLKARVARLDPEPADGAAPGPEPPPPSGTTAFVPLSSLKR